MTRYLLGMLAEEEQVRLEQEFLADDRYYEQLLVVEDELTYRWLRDDLSQEERRGFETRFLGSSQGRAKAAFAEALLGVASKLGSDAAMPRERRCLFGVWLPTPQLAVATAALLIVGISVFLLVQIRDLRTQVGLLQPDRRSVPQDRIASELENQRNRLLSLEHELAKRLSSPVAVSFLLLPGTSRGTEELRRLQIPSTADMVRLALVLKRGEGFKRFRAILRTADGREVWSQGDLFAGPADSGSSVALNVPVSVLYDDEYGLSLQGQTSEGTFEDAGEYRFSCTKR